MIRIFLIALAFFAQPVLAQPVFDQAPEVKANPNPRAPLAAVLTFKASGPVTTAVSITLPCAVRNGS